LHVVDTLTKAAGVAGGSDPELTKPAPAEEIDEVVRRH
jgi:hypothetical protein